MRSRPMTRDGLGVGARQVAPLAERESTMSERVTYPSVDAMLEPAVLGDLLGRSARSVALVPMTRPTRCVRHQLR